MTSIFVCVFSLMLDGILSLYNELSIFQILSLKPMFTIVSFVLIFPFFHKRYQNFYKTCAITGLAYDLLYTNTLILNMLIFLLLGFIIHKLFPYFDNNLISIIILNLIIISIYHVFTYLILVLANYLPFDMFNLSYNFFSILITNTLYFIIMFFFINFLQYKRHKKSMYSL